MAAEVEKMKTAMLRRRRSKHGILGRSWQFLQYDEDCVLTCFDGLESLAHRVGLEFSTDIHVART